MAKSSASKLYAMYDNYIPSVEIDDSPDSAQLAEENAFLDEMLSTPVVIEAYNFLLDKGDKLGHN